MNTRSNGYPRRNGMLKIPVNQVVNVIIGEHYPSRFRNNEEQFSAVTILMPNGMIYVSYRGTDNTIVGWKEDLNMSFKELVPAQTTAKNYLNKIAEKYKDKQIIVGGHSKGGNLAVYAAAYCEPKIQDRIIKVYNNDGPGFCDKVVNSEEYNRILNKVHTYIPKSSIIGRLLNHKEETTDLKGSNISVILKLGFCCFLFAIISIILQPA